MLGLPVPFPGVAGTDALRVESHAPAATPDAVVDLNERGEVVAVDEGQQGSGELGRAGEVVG